MQLTLVSSVMQDSGYALHLPMNISIEISFFNADVHKHDIKLFVVVANCSVFFF